MTATNITSPKARSTISAASGSRTSGRSWSAPLRGSFAPCRPRMPTIGRHGTKRVPGRPVAAGRIDADGFLADVRSRPFRGRRRRQLSARQSREGFHRRGRLHHHSKQTDRRRFRGSRGVGLPLGRSATQVAGALNAGLTLLRLTVTPALAAESDDAFSRLAEQGGRMIAETKITAEGSSVRVEALANSELISAAACAIRSGARSSAAR